MNNIQIRVEKQIQETMRLNLQNITLVLIISKERAMFMNLFKGPTSFEQISNTITILDQTLHSLLGSSSVSSFAKMTILDQTLHSLLAL